MTLKRYTYFVAACTYLLLIAGGMVTSTGSGLAVPDWPLSYGKLMPPMVGGIFYEHGHRMIATFVGILTVIMAFAFGRLEERRWVRNLAYGALALVILQGLLGGLTVLLLLPTAVSASHATIAQTFFLTVLLLAFVRSDWWKERGGALSSSISTSWIILPVAAIYIQLILGALVRHSAAGLAVPDFPLAYGTLLPPLDDTHLKGYTDELVRRNVWMWADGQITTWQIGIHLAHRYFGIALGFGLLAYSWKLRMMEDQPRLRKFGIAVAVLVLVQIALGVFTVLEGRPAWLATAHQSTGALLLGTTFLASMHTLRARRQTSNFSKVNDVSFVLSKS